LLNLKGDYFASIQRTLGSTFTEDYDATPWLEFCTLVLKICSDDLVAKMTDWHRMMQQLHDMWAAKGWPQRHADAYAFAVQAGQITRSDYIEITGVAPVTASRDLAEMTNAGVLVPEGKTRRRIYRPAPLENLVGHQTPQEQLSLLVDP
jgi:Fic family protein